MVFRKARDGELAQEKDGVDVLPVFSEFSLRFSEHARFNGALHGVIEEMQDEVFADSPCFLHCTTVKK